MSIAIDVKDLFDVDEKIVFNSIAEQDMTKKDLLDAVALAYEMNSDTDMQDMFKNINDKLSNMNEQDFKEMLAIIPFDVPYDDENNIEELPEEEYL